MKLKNAALAIALLCLSAAPASPFGVGQMGEDFSKMGSIFNGSGGGAAPGCASPTAPNGVVDLSQCSNAFYAAVIF